ncbi:hypothetical protein JKF63_05433 [Porcisia hertigi]|uniref:Uncharacterized protein n=1 Tax=Porcisia hertigi TaxID=2761500 RepID=A0A836LIN4_9TRYP|nr:hypothetical protein JKF63_05433 [Porcisia hertigi]
MMSTASGAAAARQVHRLLPSLLLSLFVYGLLYFCSSRSEWGPLLVNAAAPQETSSQLGKSQAAGDLSHVYANLQELNEQVFGAPYSFEAVADDRGNLPVTLPTDEEIAVAVKYARDEGRRTGLPTQDQGATLDETPALDAAKANWTTSTCSVGFACPRSSLAWASGSFTFPELLTPYTLSLPVGLTLKISLCCQYRFDGTLLRDVELYNVFLQELLQASPFQVLSAAEKRELFPQEGVLIADTWGRRRVYNTSYIPTDADVAEYNDGDGDVLILTTGALAPATLLKLIDSSAPLSGGGRGGLGTSYGSHTRVTTADAVSSPWTGADTIAPHREVEAETGEGVEAGALTATTDVQLRITSRVLKCKCPHIVTVMPLLHLQRDVLPPISIVGLGSHCGLPTSSNNTRGTHARHPVGSTLSSQQRIRQVRGADGTLGFAVSFEVTPPVASASLVTWTVRSVVEEVEEESGSSVPSGQRSQTDRRDGSSYSRGGRGNSSTSPKYGPLLLRHSRLLPVPRDWGSTTRGDGRTSATPTLGGTSSSWGSAASPFFLVEPNVRYEVSVRVSRRPLASALLVSGVGAAEGRKVQGVPSLSSSAVEAVSWSTTATAWTERTARGGFILRLPLNRSWVLPPIRPALHFGFRRSMRLTNVTMARAAVMAALDPYYSLHSSFHAFSSSESDEGARAETNKAGWLGDIERRWVGGGPGSSSHSGGSDTALRHRRPLAYYGYWENTPLRDQPLPQQPTRVLANPYMHNFSVDQDGDNTGGDGEVGSVPVPLFLGRNLFAYLVRDVDDVCDPVVLEERDLWAVQSHITTTGPRTACGEEQNVSALVLRQLLMRIRVEPKLGVTVPNTTWIADGGRLAEAAREGYYRCEARSSAADTSRAAKSESTVSPPLCVAVPDVRRDASEVYASLRMSSRGVYEVVWVARVVVRDERLIRKENLDPLYTTVIPVTPSAEATSSALFVVEVRSRPLLVIRRLASYPRMVAVTLPMHARRWVVSAPRALTAPQPRHGASHADGSVTDVLSGHAPTGYWRSRLPVRVLSVDEQLTAELDTNDVPNVQRTLPNGTLEFVAQDPGDVLSMPVVIDGEARVLTYTSKCPETRVEYQIDVVAFPPPPVVPAFSPIYTEEGCVLLVAPREVRKDEVAEWHVPPCASAQNPPYLVERTISVEEQEEMRIITTAEDGGRPLVLEADNAARRPVTALMACGVEAYHHCDVVWSAHNFVAAVHKTYSLRRCQRPPDLVFHENGYQQRISYPQEKVFELPAVSEIAYTRVKASALEAPDAPYMSTDAVGVVSRQRRHRRIIPVAGSAADIGYSFNYTGQQNYFEVDLLPVEDAVSHQLWVTRHHYNANDSETMVLRRRTRTDVQQLRQEDTPVGGVDTYEWDAAAPAAAGGSNLSKETDPFWGEHHASRVPDSPRESASPSEGVAEGAEQPARRGYSKHWHDEQLDTELAQNCTLLHEAEARRLRVSGLGDASLFLMNYVVQASSVVLKAEVEAEGPEFVRRGMCVEQPGYVAVLAVNPRGVVRGDDSYGAALTPPPAPAVAVLPFCAPQYAFSRYPELFSVYGYDFTWSCPDAAVMTVEKHHQTFSTLYHTPERNDRAAAVPSEKASETLCQLSVVNHITHTEQRDWFLVKRVYPSTLPATAFVVLSRNAADSLQVVPPSSAAAARSNLRPRGGGNTAGTQRSSGEQSREQQQQSARSLSATRSAPTQAGSASPTVITMERLYTAPPNTYPFIRAWHIVGKSAVLHVDAPSDPTLVRWAVTSVVPASPTTVGLQVLIDKVEFQLLPHHPAAVARGRGGSTALIKGLHTPGLYTITHTLPDPQNPNVCPRVTLTEMLDVFHAQVRARELFVCGDTAVLQAVPIPREIAHEFVGQWEVVSLATDERTVLTAGVNFTGIHFDRGTRAETLVHGLPFGVVTIRWAVYRLLPSLAEAASTPLYSTASGENLEGASMRGREAPSETSPTQKHRVLVDYDTVEVFVLTENLPSHRLVTLADRATILTTSSTQNWRLGAAMASPGLAAAAPSGIESMVRMSLRDIHNYSSSGGQSRYSSSEESAGAAHALLHTYLGLHPRPGSGVLVLEQLPVGTVHLHYDLVPSRSIFGRMEGHTCTLKGHYEVERVSAYLTATTSMDHECDGYTGQGRITLCLHTDGAPETGSGGLKGNAKHYRTSSLSKERKLHSSRADMQFWQSQVRLIDPAALEATIKRGAREVEQLSGGQCATPWWVSPTTRWFNPSYTSAGAASLPGRCISFKVKAGRHLSAREVSQPLFLSVPRPPSSSTPKLSAVSGLYADRVGSGDTARGATHTTRTCPFHGDFISTRIIDGTPGAEAGVAASAISAGEGNARGGGHGTASGVRSRLSLSQRFQIGLPHTLGDAAASFASAFMGRDGTAGGDDSSGGGGGAWGIRYLPVLQPATLRRANTTMRPMVGLRGIQDDVAYEVNISGRTTALGTSANAPGKSAPEATVLLRLDLSHPRQLGGFALFPAMATESTPTRKTGTASMSSEAVRGASQNEIHAADSTTSGGARVMELRRHSLLHKCVDGTLRGADVLQYWTETNRPDGHVDRTAQEWLDYAFAVRDAPVPCDVLFSSLDHLISRTHGDDPATTTSTPPPSSFSGGRYSRGAHGQQRDELRQGAVPSHPQQQQYISLAELELQVESIGRQRQWTADGIDVTGLSANLQHALRNRRVTRSQLHAIEAARKTRQEADEAATLVEEARRQQQPRQHELQYAPSHLSPTERLANALRAYHGIAQDSEVAVLRIRLPLQESFAVPYDLFLRAALHKDVLCGTSIDPPPSITDPAVQPTVTNPHSLVPLGRLEVRDMAPVLSTYPAIVRQCEVEGDMPVLTIELTGANFARTTFSSDSVTLEEIPNPALAGDGASHHPDVGLTACIEEMRRGLKAVVEASSRKRLYLQLHACPAFKVLSPVEYNENQESEALLRRLQLPRYLRVTVRDAIHPDSFLTLSTLSAGGGASAWRWVPGSEIPKNITATSTDASFVVEICPTLARLHLHSSASMTPTYAAATLTTTTSGADRGRPQRESGGWWGLGGRSAKSPAPVTATAAAAAGTPVQPAGPSFSAPPTRSLLLCEADLRQYGFQLGIELIGDTWTPPVGEQGDRAGSHTRSAAHDGAVVHDRHGPYTVLPRQRSPADMALINGFSVVEHHSLDSSHHLYMKGGGAYRSYFINYLFSELLNDPAVLEGHRFVHRYNDTFASITVPPLTAKSAAAASRHAYRGGVGLRGRGRDAGVAEREGASDLYAAQVRQSASWQQSTDGGNVDPTMTATSSRRVTTETFPGAFPALRQFCKIEEILFAVPGIATECRGCLLADRTFYVAGDLTGVWSASSSPGASAAAPGATTTAASILGTPAAGSTAGGAASVARLGWDDRRYTRPLVIPWDSVASVPRYWHFDWVCSAAAHRALERLALEISGRSDGAALSIVMDLVLYRLRGVDGKELPVAQRPMVLLSSSPVEVADVLRQNRARPRRAGTGTGQTTLAAPLTLNVNQTVAYSAYAQLADDTLRRRRRTPTVFDYHRDDRDAGGLLVVNASVFLKVCTRHGDKVIDGVASCVVVSISDALLTLEAPRVVMPSVSWTRLLLGGNGGGRGSGRRASEDSYDASPSPVSLVVLVYHVLMTFVVHELLPLLGVVVVTAPPGTDPALSESLLEDQRRAHVAFTLMAFLSFFFLYAYGPPSVWVGLCLVVWSVSIYTSPRSWQFLLFVASMVYMRYLM